MSKPRRRLLRAVAAVVVLTTLGACTDDDDADDSTTTVAPVTTTEQTSTTAQPPTTDTTAPAEPALVLGLLKPATGLLSVLFDAQEAGLQLAVDDIAAAGGVLGGPLGVVSADEPADGDVAAAIGELVDAGATGILGPMSSSSARAALTPLADRGTLACSASATAPDLTAGASGAFFRTAISDAVTVQFVAQHVSDRREAAGVAEGDAYRVAIIAREDDYGIQVGNGLASALLAREIDASVVSYPPRRVILEEEAAEVAALDPDVVVLVSYSESATLVADLLGAGVPAGVLIGLDGSFDPRLAEAASPDDPAAVDGLEVLGTTGGRAFIDRLVAVPDTEQVIYGAQMYDCAIVIALAAEAAGSTDPTLYGPMIAGVTSEGRACSTYEDCVANLHAGEDIDYEGVSGGLGFDEKGDVSQTRFTVATFTGGEPAEVSSTDVDLDELRQVEAYVQAIFVSRLQQVLTVLGYYEGPINGIYSDEVTAAVGALQEDLGVPVTGVYDEATDAALRARHGDVAATLDQSVAGIQQLLTDLGFYAGPIDGVYSEETVEAIRALQAELGVPETGLLDAATLQAAYERGLTVGESTPPPTTEAPTTEPPVTEPPETDPPETDTPTTPPPATDAPTTTVPATTVPPTTVPPTTVAPTTTVPEVPEPELTLLETLQADPEGRFTELIALVESSGFAPDLGLLGRVTVLAPTDDAFAAMDQAQLEAIRNDPVLAASVLSYHMLEAELTLEQLAALTEVRTIHGAMIAISVDGETVLFNGVAGIAPELPASNGTVIALSGVLSLPVG